MFVFINSKESLHRLPSNATKKKQYQRKERTCSTPTPIEVIQKNSLSNQYRKHLSGPSTPHQLILL